ncbi:aldehyde dehydrogenase family protein [Aquibium microcysteis]|uniref:aldehyde dehydrogenase family protein n=1 Tax=Aquibium microcysteis TaxID=675281 RepID=UPI00165D2E78|nr:aldehyde dehydrogenase family protein [Aquibium microcysteis]
MTEELETLVARYRAGGGVEGLPARHFIGGEWSPSASGRTMESLDPGTGQPFHRFASGDAGDVDRAVRSADAALKGAWSRVSPAARGAVLARAAILIREAGPRLAFAETLDSGKPLQEAEGDVQGAARCFEYYSGLPDKLEGRTLPLGPDHLGYTSWEPIGVTAHIIPWNYPLSTFARGIAPALAAGCTVVARPAEQTPLTALMLAEILMQAGLPAGVLNVVTGTGVETGAPLVAHPLVRQVTFTGSTATGIEVMRAAARNVTSVLPELGGKSPVVVLHDTDLDAAVDGVIGAIFENAGQICSAGSRLVVERAVHADMLERLVARARAIRIGHGLRRPDMGPITSAEQRARIAAFVDGARARGLEIATGGHAVTDPATGLGWFYEPTIIDRVPVDDPIAQEEIFGPVLAVQVVEDAEEALAVANSTRFALVAGVYTRDFSAAHDLARRIDAGQVYINEYFAGGIALPFGGNRMSGFGREKGVDAVRTYMKLKSVAARVSSGR